MELSLLVRKDMKSSVNPFDAHHLAVKRPPLFTATNGGVAKKHKSGEQDGIADEDPLNIQSISEQIFAEDSGPAIANGLPSEVCIV